MDLDLTPEGLDNLMTLIFDLESDGREDNDAGKIAQALEIRSIMVRDHGLSLELCLDDYKWIPVSEVLIGYVWLGGTLNMASPNSNDQWFAFVDGQDRMVPKGTILYQDPAYTIPLRTIG